MEDIRTENTAIITKPKEEWLLKISGWVGSSLDLEKITPKCLIWPLDIRWEEREEIGHLVFPERLTDFHYGSDELDQNLREMANKAPGIHKLWKMTEDLPSLSKILIEEREQEQNE